jgi:uncharacterized membrane protein YidH (DUF202 family)
VPMSEVSLSDRRVHTRYLMTVAFLSWLRLSLYMAIVAVAIVLSFHLKSQPSKLELRMALPLGIIFWLLSLACLASGFANYVKTIMRFSRRAALVQTGWKTEVVSRKSSICYHHANLVVRFSPSLQLQ